MLAAITTELRADLSARGVPYNVVYGPERMTNTISAASHIVVERDRQQGDTVADPPVKTRNPHVIYARWIGAIVRVFARDMSPGATVGEHERIADKVIDQIIVALREIAARRRTLMQYRSSKLLSAQEAEASGLQAWPGVIYEMRLAVGRGVTDAPYDGNAPAETTKGPGGFGVSTTLVATGPDPTTDLPGATTRV